MGISARFSGTVVWLVQSNYVCRGQLPMAELPETAAAGNQATPGSGVFFAFLLVGRPAALIE
jgi:hypothetical protein